MAQVDIAKIDGDLVGFRRLRPQVLDIRGHLIRPYTICMDGIWMALHGVQGESTVEPQKFRRVMSAPRSGPPPLQVLKIVRLNPPFANVPESEIRHPEQDSVPNGAVVAVSIDGRHRFSKLSRLSITLTSGHGIEGDAHYGAFARHRYLARRNPKAPNLRQVHLLPSQLFDALRTSGFEVRPEISARTLLRSRSISNASPWARCSGLALQRRSNLPTSARALRPHRSLQVRIEDAGQTGGPRFWGTTCAILLLPSARAPASCSVPVR
jgi:hypothetical protein